MKKELKLKSNSDNEDGQTLQREEVQESYAEYSEKKAN